MPDPLQNASWIQLNHAWMHGKTKWVQIGGLCMFIMKSYWSYQEYMDQNIRTNEEADPLTYYMCYLSWIPWICFKLAVTDKWEKWEELVSQVKILPVSNANRLTPIIDWTKILESCKKEHCAKIYARTAWPDCLWYPSSAIQKTASLLWTSWIAYFSAL